MNMYIYTVIFMKTQEIVYHMFLNINLPFPRCMAGCLLMHIGSELVREALWDCLGTLDVFEYSSVVAITIVMSSYGMALVR
jgi:MFS superfamily sulfate permease-like transporter